MKKTRFLSLLLALALLLLPAASMADTSGAASLSAGAVAVVSPSAQPNTTNADFYELIADALHMNTTNPAVLITELQSQINTAAANAPDVHDRSDDRSEFDSPNNDSSFGEGENLWERFLRENAFTMMSKSISVIESEYFSHDFDMTESAPKSTSSPDETAALVQSAAMLRDANLWYAISTGQMENAGPRPYTEPVQEEEPEECPDGVCQ